jgi:hypothetical protein
VSRGDVRGEFDEGLVDARVPQTLLVDSVSGASQKETKSQGMSFSVSAIERQMLYVRKAAEAFALKG